VNLPFDMTGPGLAGSLADAATAGGRGTSAFTSSGAPTGDAPSAVGLFASLLGLAEDSAGPASVPGPTATESGELGAVAAGRQSNNWLQVQIGDLDLKELSSTLDSLTTGLSETANGTAAAQELAQTLRAATPENTDLDGLADLMGRLSALIEGYADRLEAEQPPSPELLAEAQLAVQLPGAIAEWLSSFTKPDAGTGATNAGAGSSQNPSTPRAALDQLIAILGQATRGGAPGSGGQPSLVPAKENGSGQAQVPSKANLGPSLRSSVPPEPGQIIARIAELTGPGRSSAVPGNGQNAGSDAQPQAPQPQGSQPQGSQTPQGSPIHQGSELAAKLRSLSGELDIMRQALKPHGTNSNTKSSGSADTFSPEMLLGQKSAAPVSGVAAEAGAGKARAELAASLQSRLNAPAAANGQTEARPGSTGSAPSLGEHLKAQMSPAGARSTTVSPTQASTAQTAQATQSAQMRMVDAGADPVVTQQVTAQGAPTVSADAASAARPMQAAYQPPQINMPQVAFEMTRNMQAGQNRFQIRLDPPELGRIDVRMDVDQNGAVKAHLTADRPETLDMLQRDARALERALQQAGLDSSKTNLEFSLRQHGFGQNQAGQNGDGAAGDDRSGRAANGGAKTSDTTESPDESAATPYRGVATPGGLNLWV